MCKILITFKNSREAIKADNLCLQHKLKAQVVATPESISTECGMSLVVEVSLKSMIVDLFEAEKIEYSIHD